MTQAPLRVRGRDVDGFRRAVAAHAAAWSGGAVEARWDGLPELQAAALGPDDPAADVLIVPADWLPALAASGRAVPLRGQPPAGWPDAWAPSFHEGIRWAGEVYGLPFHDGPQLLFTRPGLGLRPPATWPELVEQAATLHEPGVRAGTVLAGVPDGHNNVYDFVLHLWRFGGDLPHLDSAPTRAALSFLRELATTLVSPDAHRLDSVGSGAEFAAGRVGVAVNWAGYAALAAASGVDFACAVAPGTTVNAFWVACVTSTCADPDRAWDYLRHAASPAMDRETTRAGASGGRRDTWSDPAVLAGHPEYALFDAAHANSRPLPRIPQLPALVEILNELVDAVVWRGEPPDPAITRAQRTTDHLLAPGAPR